MPDNSWITESIVQFTRSPAWSTPIDNFVDEHCYIFTNDEEMVVEMTEVHIAFRKLMDELLTTYMQEIGVELETAICALRDSTQSGGVTEEPARQFLNYIFYADDFRSFHKMMVKRNIELDILTSRALRRLEQGGSSENTSLENTMEEDDALRLAIEASLEDEKTAHRLLELEDIQIQEALALSIAAEEDRVRRAGRAMEEAGAQQTKTQNLSLLEEEKERVIQKLEQCALEMRKENMTRGLASAKSTAGCEARPAMPKAPEPSAQQNEERKESASTAAPNAAPTVAPLPVLSTPSPLPGCKKFGFKTLPSIQPSFRQLEKSVAKNVALPLDDNPKTVAQEVDQRSPTLEEIQARAQYMREQREKILQQNRAKREKELKEFTALGGKTEGKKSHLCESTKQMTVDLARRLREDIVREATK